MNIASEINKFTGFSDLSILNMRGKKPQTDEPDEAERLFKKTKEPKNIEHAWTAMSRPQLKNLNQKTLKTFIVIGIVVALLLVAMQEFMLILVVLSLIFVSYMLSQTPSEHIRYEISNHGIMYNDKMYEWDNMKHFFVTQNQDLRIVAIDLYEGIPVRLYLTLNPGDEQKVLELVKKRVTYLEEEPKTTLDRAYDKVLGRLNLEN